MGWMFLNDDLKINKTHPVIQDVIQMVSQEGREYFPKKFNEIIENYKINNPHEKYITHWD